MLPPYPKSVIEGVLGTLSLQPNSYNNYSYKTLWVSWALTPKWAQLPLPMAMAHLERKAIWKLAPARRCRSATKHVPHSRAVAVGAASL